LTNPNPLQDTSNQTKTSDYRLAHTITAQHSTTNEQTQLNHYCQIISTV